MPGTAIVQASLPLDRRARRLEAAAGLSSRLWGVSAAFVDHDLDGADRALQAGLRLTPDLVDAHFYRGVRSQRGNFREAAACFRRATELKPDYAVAFSNLGPCKDEVGGYSLRGSRQPPGKRSAGAPGVRTNLRSEPPGPCRRASCALPFTRSYPSTGMRLALEGFNDLPWVAKD